MAARYPKTSPFQDDFEYFASLQEGSSTVYNVKVPDSSWLRYPAHTDQTTDLDATKSLVTSKVNGVFMGPTMQLTISSTDAFTYAGTSGTRITFASAISGDLGYVPGEFLMVEFMNDLSGSALPTPHSQRYQGVWLTDTTLWVQSGSTWDITAGTMNVPMHLLGKNQLIEALFMAKAQGTGNDITFLARIDPYFQAISHGYGIDIAYNSDGTRILSLFKYNYGAPGIPKLVTSSTVTLNKVNGSDLEVLQHIRIEVFDRPEGDVGVSDTDATVIRVWLNKSEDDDAPTLEYEDKGGVLSSTTDTGMLPYSPGTFGVYFPIANTLYLDAIEVIDDFEVSRISGGYRLGRTLRELKEAVKLKAFAGSTTNYPDELIEQAINYSLSEVLDTVGGSAFFLHQTESLSPTTVDTDTYKFPNRVDQIVEIRKNNLKVTSWNLISRDSNTGELTVYIPGVKPPFDVTFISARRELIDLDDACPIPRNRDEAVVAGAALRIVGEADGDRRRYQALATRYQVAIRRLLAAMNKMQRQTKARARVPISRGFPWDRYVAREDQYWNF